MLERANANDRRAASRKRPRSRRAWWVGRIVAVTAVSCVTGGWLTRPASAAEPTAASPSPTLSIRNDKGLEFEREYGIHRPSSSAFLRWVQGVKYGLDTATFTAEEQIKRLEFSYNIGTPGPARGDAQSDYALPLFGRFGQPRLQSQLTTHDADTGSPYFGLKLTIPFGPGGEARAKVKLTPAEKREKSDKRRALRFAVESPPNEIPRHDSAD